MIELRKDDNTLVNRCKCGLRRGRKNVNVLILPHHLCLFSQNLFDSRHQDEHDLVIGLLIT